MLDEFYNKKSDKQSRSVLMETQWKKVDEYHIVQVAKTERWEFNWWVLSWMTKSLFSN